MVDFKDWLANETILSFGKHKNKDHTDPSTDSGWLNWALQNVNNPGLISPEFRREIEEELRKRKAAKAVTPAVPTPKTLPSVSPAAAPTWVLANISGNNSYGLRIGQPIALAKKADGSWEFVTLDKERKSGFIPGENVKSVAASVKDEAGQPVKATSIEELMAKLNPPQEKKPDQHILSDEMMSDEQKAIDAKFQQTQNDKNENIVIKALAGTGKTTALKHLAWKYGNPKQKWLYLVFNTKNKVEAKEKFPPWVEVATTNGFLGQLLGLPENKSKMKQTNRLVEIGKNHPNEKGIIEKARILVDQAPAFRQLLTQFGLPEKEAANNVSADPRLKKTLSSLLNSMRYVFKEQVLTLTGLAKSFSVDPRQADMQAKLQEVMGKYDFDTELSDIKDRIRKYEGSYGDTIRGYLRRILNYDFMQKDYKKEILEGTEWMLKETMPHASQHVLKKDDFEYNMGHYRDFNDDLWFASTHADELHWPHYDVVLADESQDFNQNQLIAVKKLHEAGAKIVAVGDENQALYRFRGSDSDAFNNLSTQLGSTSKDKDWKPHTLSKNFRSRPAILDYANQHTHVNNLQQGKVFKDGDPGKVTDQDTTYDDAFNQLREEKRKTGKVKQTAFISRTNEPLVNAALKLLASAIPFIIVGKDVAKDLLQHIDKIVRMTGLGDFSPIESLQEKLDDHFRKEEEHYSGSSSKRAYMQGLQDTTNALGNCIKQFAPNLSEDYPGDRMAYGRGNRPPTKNISQFKAWLKANLSGLDVAENERDLQEYRKKTEEGNPVILTTSHKSKGLEFERVYILRNDQFPHPKAKRAEDLAQEANARFVSYTRAMDELHILKLKGQPGVPDKD